METIFNWIAEGFAHSNTVGMLTTCVALCLASLIGYVSYLIGGSLWAFIEDLSLKEALCKEEKKVDYYKSYTQSMLHSCDDKELWEKHTTPHGTHYYRKSRIKYVTYYVSKYKGPLLVGNLMAIAALVGLGIVLDVFLWAPVVTSVVGGSVGLMFLARGVRRLQKKLNAHLADKDAHKEKEKEDV